MNILQHDNILLRHDEIQVIGSSLDPIEDILNFITTLKSKGFTSDILKEVHKFTDATEIDETAKLVSLHVNIATGLAEQAFSGPPETAFLPLYYSTLNLAKVHLLFLGKREDLEDNRNKRHGAKYEEKGMTETFLDEEVKIFEKGTIPLIYEAISGKAISKSGHEVKLRELYSRISSIGAEYSMITGKQSDVLCHAAKVVSDDKNGHYIRIDILEPYYQSNPPEPELLKAYSGLKFVKPYYETDKIPDDLKKAKLKLIGGVKRHLNSDRLDRLDGGTLSWLSCTPISSSDHVFNEEMCIMLAYFHLSNVVRYNPKHLHKLMDSKYWSVMLGLRKHGYLTFLKLMWGNYNKKSFDIR